MKLLAIALAFFVVQDDFSGPQKGEALPGCTVKVIYGPSENQDLDLLAEVADSPNLILFVHEVTRPSIGLVRSVANYATTRTDDGFKTHVVFLTSDPTDTQNWMVRAKNALPRNVNIGISPDGIEGPGAFGLNRKMQITAVVSSEKKVTANFAIISPNIPTDAVGICSAIAKTLGDEKMPTAQELGVRARDRNARGDGQYERLMRPFIQKDLDDEKVAELAVGIEKAADADPNLKKRIYAVTNRIIDAGKLSNYGTAKAQEYLKKWSKEFADDDKEEMDDSRPDKSIELNVEQNNTSLP